MPTFIDRYTQGSKDYKQLTICFNYTCPECYEPHGFCCQHSAKAAYDQQKICEDGSFSNSRCDICNGLPGNRYKAHGIVVDGERYHLEICADCVMHIANDGLPEEE